MSKWWRTVAGGLRRAADTTRSYHTIQAIPRESSGSKISAKDRAQGRIPAVVLALNYSSTNPSDATTTTARKHLLTTERKQIQSILKSGELPFFCSSTCRLQIRAGSGSSVLLESGNVLPIKVHTDPETGKILNLVFVWVDEGSKLKVDVPVVFKGEDACPGLKKGGYLKRLRTTVKYMCPSDQIPPKIEVDLSNVDIGEKVLIRDLDVHPSLKLLTKFDSLPVCKILATKLDEPEPAT